MPLQYSRSLLSGGRTLVFADVHGSPFSLDNSLADLRGSFPLTRLFVSIEIFANTDLAARAVTACEAIEQTGMALAAIAMAIARLLIKHFLDARRDGIGVLHHGI